MVNFAVADLDQRHADLNARGIDTEEIITVNKGVRLSSSISPASTSTNAGAIRRPSKRSAIWALRGR